MSDTDNKAQNKAPNNLKDTRDKRKRVERIKNGIIIAIFVSIIVSILAVIGLIVAIVNMVILGNKVEKLEQGSSATVTQSSTVTAQDDSNLILPGSGEVSKVYLTFDDGPSDNTDRILDILKENDVKATFFLVAKEDEASKDRIKRMAAEGHSVGIHSFAHKYSEVYSSLDAFKTDVDKMITYVDGILGYKPKLYRFPGGSGNKVTNVDIKECIDYLDSKNLAYYDWNVSGGDSSSNAYTSDELVENVMKDVLKYKTSVVLLHDANAKGTTAEALPRLIEALQASNVSLLPITDDTPPVQHVKAK